MSPHPGNNTYVLGTHDSLVDLLNHSEPRRLRAERLKMPHCLLTAILLSGNLVIDIECLGGDVTYRSDLSHRAKRREGSAAACCSSSILFVYILVINLVRSHLYIATKSLPLSVPDVLH